MTVKQLKVLIADLPDDALVGVGGRDDRGPMASGYPTFTDSTRIKKITYLLQISSENVFVLEGGETFA